MQEPLFWPWACENRRRDIQSSRSRDGVPATFAAERPPGRDGWARRGTLRILTAREEATYFSSVPCVTLRCPALRVGSTQVIAGLELDGARRGEERRGEETKGEQRGGGESYYEKCSTGIIIIEHDSYQFVQKYCTAWKAQSVVYSTVVPEVPYRTCSAVQYIALWYRSLRPAYEGTSDHWETPPPEHQSRPCTTDRLSTHTRKDQKGPESTASLFLRLMAHPVRAEPGKSAAKRICSFQLRRYLVMHVGEHSPDEQKAALQPAEKRRQTR